MGATPGQRKRNPQQQPKPKPPKVASGNGQKRDKGGRFA